MRIATVLTVASAYIVFVDALAQDEPGHPMLRELSAQNAMFYGYQSTSCENWGGTCTLSEVVNNLNLASSSCSVSVPIPSDNYVGDNRKNKNDNGASASARPSIAISSTGPTNSATGQVPWKHYLNAPKTAQSQVTLNLPGVYNMLMTATDYNADATCPGCVAVTDDFRPRFKDWQCATSGTTTSQLAKSTLDAAKGIENDYDLHVHNIQNNPGSGEVDSCSHYTSDVVTSWPSPASGTCFSQATWDSLKAGSIYAGGKLQQMIPVTIPWSWCCSKSASVKEKLVQYTCPSTAPQNSVCAGRGDAASDCTMKTCLATTGDEMATATFVIKDAVQTASTTVTHAFTQVPADADTTKNVYYGIPCTSFDNTNEECKYKVKLSELITAELKSKHPELFTNAETPDYVKWRYNVDGGEWHYWNPNNDGLVFDDPTTTVNIQAWSYFGQVGGDMSFNVNLYVHSTLTCANFDAMWTGGATEEVGGAYCSVEDSDFAIFNMNFASASDVVPVGANEVSGTFSGVTCKIMVKELDASDTTAKPLLDSTTAPVNQDFAVELVHQPRTAQKTEAKVVCTFKREVHDNEGDGAGYSTPAAAQHTIECSHGFTMTDCSKPKLDTSTAEVCANKCAGPSVIGYGELCSGLAVTSNAGATSVTTMADAACCDKCGSELECRAAGTSESVKHCAFSSSYYYAPLLAELSAAEETVFSSETTTALLGATAMIAVVALVVVKRRAEAAARAEETNDAYYPLLE